MCGCRKENCEFAKQWKKLIDEEELVKKTRSATTAAGAERCCFYPLRALPCGGQSGACKSLNGWIEALGETKEFLQTKTSAKRKQRNGRTMAFRAAAKAAKRAKSMTL